MAGASLAGPAPAQALITPPVTVAGPSSDIADFGGVAMAPDGSGGLVFTRIVEGVPHVFASRYVGGRWSTPIRVDDGVPYEASQARIAAGRGGELLVIWVSQVATVHGRVRYGLYSASLGRGASSFGPFQVVDPEVGEGSPAGVDPSLSATAPSQAIVAYRAITYRFDGSKPVQVTQLRPGDVLADVRVARLKEDRWSRLGAINVSQEISMRAPAAGNGPEVGAGIDGNAVVAWQEPDQSGTARIYTRRIFGTVPGPILLASPTSWDGAPVSGDANAFSLAVTPLDQARIAMRIAPNGGQGPVRLFLNTLPPGYAVPSSALLGPEQVGAASGPAAIGLPGVAAHEKGGQEGVLRLAYVSGGRLAQDQVDQSGKLVPLSFPTGPPATPGAEAGAAVDPEGGGVVAYPALDANGNPALAVRQEFAGGGAQTGLLSGRQQGGPVAELHVAGTGTGDALVGFRQGEPGHYEIVGERVSAPPTSFKVKGPKGWTKPRAVRLRWQPAKTTVGGVSYTVLLGGRAASRPLRRRAFHPHPGQLGNGERVARVLATDALGQQVLSGKVKLLVDGQPPLVRIAGPGAGRTIAVRLSDAQSGVAAKTSRVEFGDGSSAHGGSELRHAYGAPGRYRVVVQARDRVGNRTVRRYEVRLP